MRHDPKFRAVFCRVCVPFLPVAAQLMASLPEVMLFFNRPAGSMVMNALLQAAMTESNDPHATVPYADVGDRFGVSRTHVRSLLVAAQDAGLVKLHARGGHRVEILPRMWSCTDHGMAIGMYLNDACYLVAMKNVLGKHACPRPDARSLGCRTDRWDGGPPLSLVVIRGPKLGLERASASPR
jgi:hypothetical protein